MVQSVRSVELAVGLAVIAGSVLVVRSSREQQLVESQISIAARLARLSDDHVPGLDLEQAFSTSRRTELDRGLVIVHFGRGRAVFHNETGKLRSFRIDLSQLPSNDTQLTTDAAKEIAIQYVNALKTPSTRWSVASVSDDSARLLLQFTGFIVERMTELKVNVTVDKRHWAVSDVSVEGWHEYAQSAHMPVVEKSAAFRDGVDAYFRCEPFSDARVGFRELVLGVPRTMSDTSRIALNWTKEHEDLRLESRAIPLYRVRIDSTSGDGVQWIEVDGRTGRVLSVIWSGRLADKPFQKPLRLGPQLTVKAGVAATNVNLVATKEVRRERPEGMSVGLLVLDALVNAVVVQDAKQVWILNGQDWVSYSTDADGWQTILLTSKAQAIRFGSGR